MDPAGLPALLDAIRHLHGAEATWVESVPVREVFRQPRRGGTVTYIDRVVWEGEVQVFDLTGHPTASRCYAWSHATEGTRRRFVAVLHVPPVDSPEKAVRASIVAEAKARW